MNPNINTFNSLPCWSTASIGEGSQRLASAVESLGLGDHLNQCKALQSRFFTLHCLLESAHGFMVTHVFTSAVLVTLLIGLGSLVL